MTHPLHERAVLIVRNLKRSESELISVLQEIDDEKVFRHLGFSSLYLYATKALGLPEGQAYSLITVSRKAKQIPELKQAVATGKINTSQARRITSVITQDNKTEWIEKAATLGQRELEKEIAKAAPSQAVREKMTYVTETRIELKLGISETLMKDLERVKDLLSQRTKKPSSLEDALGEIVTFYLAKNDPLKKVQRDKTLSSRREHMATRRGKRTPIPLPLKREVLLRDKGQCTYQTHGQRCDQKRWIQIHHKIPVASGGTHAPENLTHLCFHHHKLQHERLQ
jgi:5-methylcytosine-specific restriction endonuclease McrA